ncbi:MAG: hypothetical protein ACP5HH_07265 [Fervidicoccaceae archaeon]
MGEKEYKVHFSFTIDKEKASMLRQYVYERRSRGEKITLSKFIEDAVFEKMEREKLR